MKKIYLEAFPRSERKPFGMMLRMQKKGDMELMSLMDGTQMVGLAITVLYQDMVLLDYFAMEKSCRGKNYGSEALQLLLERYQEKRMIFEIERSDHIKDEQDQRVRRKHFYLRNGLKETGIYISLFGVPMEILTEGKPLTYEEYHQLYTGAMGPTIARMVKQTDL